MKKNTQVLMSNLFPNLIETWNSYNKIVKVSILLAIAIFTKLFLYFFLVLTINWNTVLFKAAKDGSLVKAKIALFFMANAEQIAPFDGKQWTPLAHALSNKRPEIIRLFAEKGWGMNPKYTLSSDKNRWITLAHLAVRSNDQATINTFAGVGGSFTYCNSEHQNGLTLAVSNNKKIAATTLARHLDINCPDGAGLHPLTLAMEIEDSLQRDEWLILLDSLGANPYATNDEGDTPLHQVLDRSGSAMMTLGAYAGMIWILQKNGGAVTIPNKRGTTPLMAAAKNGNGKAMDALTKRGASLTRKNKAGKNVFDILDSKGNDRLFSKYSKQLKHKDPKAFKKLQKRFPHRISPKGEVLKRPIVKPKGRPHARRGVRPKGGGLGKLLKRASPILFIIDILSWF